MQVDYIILGQGIAGTMLCRSLMKAGKRPLVIDEYNPYTASQVASGIINPVTGRRVVRTWMIEELLPTAIEIYDEISNELGVSVARQIDILNYHTTEQMSNAWHERMVQGEDYIQAVYDTEVYGKHFNIGTGVNITSPCVLIDMPLLLGRWRARLKENGALLEERFDITGCEFAYDKVQYKGITADKLILCNGVGAFDNAYFKRLPHALSKGEALHIHIPDLPATNIYKQGMSLVPMGNDMFWLGSSFEWEYEHSEPTEVFRNNAVKQLARWLKLPYRIQHHIASVRAGSLERRPFVGLHPLHKAVGILGGLGTKGCSLAPYFAEQFAAHLLHNKSILPEVDVNRFAKTLSR